MRIWLVRHGQSEGNADPNVYFEKKDHEIDITTQGEEDARSAAYEIHRICGHFNKLLEYPHVDRPIWNFALYSSSYLRARRTANIVRDKLENDFFGDNYCVLRDETLPILREREWGDLREAVRLGGNLNNYFDFYYRPKGGESFCDCYSRVMLFHQHLLMRGYGDNIVVAHGEFNKVYAMYLTGMSIEDFERYDSPKNGGVLLIQDQELSSLTPLTIRNR